MWKDCSGKLHRDFARTKRVVARRPRTYLHWRKPGENMDEIARIADQLERAFDGDPWWGPSTRAALAGIDAEAATRRVVAEAHTVWEIVLHMTAWQREVARRLREGTAREPADGDWPQLPEPTQANWTIALEALERANREAVLAVRDMDLGRLDELIGEERDRPVGSGVSRYVTLHGLVQHNVAHTAQISLLAKALR